MKDTYEETIVRPTLRTERPVAQTEGPARLAKDFRRAPEDVRPETKGL